MSEGLLRRADQDRQAYVQRYFQADWRSSLLYDMQFNTDRVSMEDAVDAVLTLVGRPILTVSESETPRARE
jgi:hypothetical protein